MPVFRVKRTKNYTVMSNIHLRDKRLSLKAKGLLSQMLSLPDNWDYTLRGLAAINREQVDAIRQGVRELEEQGYVVRRRLRDEEGHMGKTEYCIYEEPRLVLPTEEEPEWAYPMRGNDTQLSKELPTKEI